MTKSVRSRYRIDVLLALGVMFSVPVRATEDAEHKRRYEEPRFDVRDQAIEVIRWVDRVNGMYFKKNNTPVVGCDEDEVEVEMTFQFPVADTDEAIIQYPGVKDGSNVLCLRPLSDTDQSTSSSGDGYDRRQLGNSYVDYVEVVSNEPSNEPSGGSLAGPNGDDDAKSTRYYMVKGVDSGTYRKAKYLFLKKALCGSVGSVAIAIVPWMLRNRFSSRLQEWRTRCIAAQVATVGAGCLYAMHELRSATNFTSVKDGSIKVLPVEKFQNEFSFVKRYKNICKSIRGLLRRSWSSGKDNDTREVRINYITNQKVMKEIDNPGSITCFNKNSRLPLIRLDEEPFIKERYVFVRGGVRGTK